MPSHSHARPADPEPFCVGCGRHGPQYAERKLIGPRAKPAPYLRVCLGCYQDGYRLTDPKEVARIVVAANL
jgi:hypothetical protein